MGVSEMRGGGAWVGGYLLGPRLRGFFSIWGINGYPYFPKCPCKHIKKERERERKKIK